MKKPLLYRQLNPRKLSYSVKGTPQARHLFDEFSEYVTSSWLFIGTTIQRARLVARQRYPEDDCPRRYFIFLAG